MNANGIIFVVGLVVATLGIYVISKKSKKPKIKEFLSEEGRYSQWKSLIDNYIEKEEWSNLEELLDSSVKDFPDLIKKIEKALQNKN